MTCILGIVLFLAGVFLPTGSAPTAPALSGGYRSIAGALPEGDRALASSASMRASGTVRGALVWLRARSQVRTAEVGRDGRTIQIRFRDGHTLVILPPLSREERPAATALRPLQVESGSPPRALVLAPFASQPGMGPGAFREEISSLRQAGFQVDFAQDAGVSVPIMAQLAQYSVIYMETHSGVLPDGNAIVVTGDTNTRIYSDMFREGSVMQAMVAGDPTGTLYDAVTSIFLATYVGTFSPDSIMMENGCSLLSAPLFWAVLHAHHLGALVSWDRQGLSFAEAQAAIEMIDRMVAGDDIATAIAVVQADGLGTTDAGEGPSTLGFLGDGTITLARALARTDPPTPTSTPTAAPTARATTVPVATPTPTPAPRCTQRDGCHPPELPHWPRQTAGYRTQGR